MTFATIRTGFFTERSEVSQNASSAMATVRASGAMIWTQYAVISTWVITMPTALSALPSIFITEYIHTTEGTMELTEGTESPRKTFRTMCEPCAFMTLSSTFTVTRGSIPASFTFNTGRVVVTFVAEWLAFVTCSISHEKPIFTFDTPGARAVSYVTVVNTAQGLYA